MPSPVNRFVDSRQRFGRRILKAIGIRSGFGECLVEVAGKAGPLFGARLFEGDRL
jgi:hypothetical protein